MKLRVLIGNLRETFVRELHPEHAVMWDRAQARKGYHPGDLDPVIAAGLASTRSPGKAYLPRRRWGIGGRRKRRRRIALMRRRIASLPTCWPPPLRLRYVNPAHPGECNAPGPCDGCDALDCKVRPACCARPGKLRSRLLRLDCSCSCHG